MGWHATRACVSNPLNNNGEACKRVHTLANHAIAIAYSRVFVSAVLLDIAVQQLAPSDGLKANNNRAETNFVNGNFYCSCRTFQS